MDNAAPARSLTHGLLIAAAFVVLIAGLKSAQDLIVPFLMAGFVAIISAPLLYWLHEKGLPNWAAMIIVVLSILLIGLTLSGLVGKSLDGFSKDIPVYQAKLDTKLGQGLDYLREQGVDVPDGTIRRYFDPGMAIGFAGKVFNGAGSILANVFLIFLTAIFLLGEASTLGHKLKRISNQPEKTRQQLQEFTRKLNHYIAIKTGTSLLTGFMVAIMTGLFGVDYAVLWGVLAFLLNFVPNIGSIIAAVPALLLALVQLGPASMFWLLLGYLVINNVVGNVIEPRFLGRALGLSSLVVFLSLVFWGWVLGPVGMFLSVPLTITLKLFFENQAQTQWIAVLLGPDPGEAVSDPTNPKTEEKGQS